MAARFVDDNDKHWIRFLDKVPEKLLPAAKELERIDAKRYTQELRALRRACREGYKVEDIVEAMHKSGSDWADIKLVQGMIDEAWERYDERT